MTDGKSIQITRGNKDLSRPGSNYGIEINRTGKPTVGSVPELLELDFRCGVTRKGFRVIIEGEKNDRGNRYKLKDVLKTDDFSQSRTAPSYKQKKLDIDVEEIKGISNVKCPYCRGGKSWVIKCGCGGLSCGGGVRREGNKEYHKCPWCQSVGIITGRIETLSGERSSSRQTLPNREVSKQTLISTDAPLKTLPPGSKQIQKR